MELTLYQIIVPVIALIVILYAWNLTMRQRKTIWEAFLWTVFWGGIGVIAAEPNVLSYLTALTGIKSQANALLVTSIGIIVFMLFYLIVRLEETQQRLTRVIRAMALREAGLDDKHPGQHHGNRSHEA